MEGRAIVRRLKRMGLRQFVFIFLMGSLLLPRPCSARTVTDMAGDSLELPADHHDGTWPQRVVALSPGITEIVFALGMGERLVGTTRFGDYPPEAADLPRVGGYNAPDVERIAALKPDLCLVTKDGNPEYIVRQLRELDIPVYAGNPVDLEKTIEFVQGLGEVLGVPAKGRELAGTMRRDIAAIAAQVAGLPRPGVFYQLMPEPIRSAGRDTFAGELIELAGGKNLAARPESEISPDRKFPDGELTSRGRYPCFSREDVIRMAPDVMILSAMGGLERDSLGYWKTWPCIPAVRNGRIHVVRADLLNRPGPRLVHGLALLARLLHPEAFAGTETTENAQ